MTPRRFDTLSSTEVMALAIHIERCNARRLRAFADVFREYDQVLTARFEELVTDEQEHEALLAAEFHKRFGGVIPVVEEADVDGVIESFDLDDFQDGREIEGVRFVNPSPRKREGFLNPWRSPAHAGAPETVPIRRNRDSAAGGLSDSR